MTEEEKDLTPQIFLNNEKFDIPEEGMLGLLALGDVGLKMWRMKRQTIVDATKNSEDNKEGNADNNESLQ